MERLRVEGAREEAVGAGAPWLASLAARVLRATCRGARQINVHQSMSDPIPTPHAGACPFAALRGASPNPLSMWLSPRVRRGSAVEVAPGVAVVGAVHRTDPYDHDA